MKLLQGKRRMNEFIVTKRGPADVLHIEDGMADALCFDSCTNSYDLHSSERRSSNTMVVLQDSFAVLRSTHTHTHTHTYLFSFHASPFSRRQQLLGIDVCSGISSSRFELTQGGQPWSSHLAFVFRAKSRSESRINRPSIIVP